MKYPVTLIIIIIDKLSEMRNLARIFFDSGLCFGISFGPGHPTYIRGQIRCEIHKRERERQEKKREKKKTKEVARNSVLKKLREVPGNLFRVVSGILVGGCSPAI